MFAPEQKLETVLYDIAMMVNVLRGMGSAQGRFSALKVLGRRVFGRGLVQPLLQSGGGHL
jgi:hypothetical protein